MCIRDRHVHTKSQKLDTLEQLEIYKHTKTNKNDILNEQTQFKLHALFEHITPYAHNIDVSEVDIVANNKKMCIRDRHTIYHLAHTFEYNDCFQSAEIHVNLQATSHCFIVIPV